MRLVYKGLLLVVTVLPGSPIICWGIIGERGVIEQGIDVQIGSDRSVMYEIKKVVDDMEVSDAVSEIS